jgi:hypothetical protein
MHTVFNIEVNGKILNVATVANLAAIHRVVLEHKVCVLGRI